MTHKDGPKSAYHLQHRDQDCHQKVQMPTIEKKNTFLQYPT